MGLTSSCGPPRSLLCIVRTGSDCSYLKQRGLASDGPYRCTFKFRNTLPEVAELTCGGKFLTIPPDPTLLSVDCVAASERKFQYPLTVDNDYGIALDISDIGMYEIPDGEAAELHPADAALLDDNEAGGVLNAPKGRADPTFEAAWLMRTTHMSNRAREVGFGQVEAIRKPKGAAEGRAADAAFGGGKSVSEQCDEIEASFDAVRAFDDARGLKHPSKAGVRATKVLPIIPDMARGDLKYTYIQAKFLREAPGKDTGLPWCAEDKDNSIASAEAVMRFTKLGRQSKGASIVAYMLPKEGISRDEEDVEYAQVHEFLLKELDDDDEAFCLWPKKDAVTFTNIVGGIELEVAHAQDFPDAADGVMGSQQKTFYVPRKIMKRKRKRADTNGDGANH